MWREKQKKMSVEHKKAISSQARTATPSARSCSCCVVTRCASARLSLRASASCCCRLCASAKASSSCASRRAIVCGIGWPSHKGMCVFASVSCFGSTKEVGRCAARVSLDKKIENEKCRGLWLRLGCGDRWRWQGAPSQGGRRDSPRCLRAACVRSF